jgi:hypothetical protein
VDRFEQETNEIMKEDAAIIRALKNKQIGMRNLENGKKI